MDKPRNTEPRQASLTTLEYADELARGLRAFRKRIKHDMHLSRKTDMTLYKLEEALESLYVIAREVQ